MKKYIIILCLVLLCACGKEKTISKGTPGVEEVLEERAQSYDTTEPEYWDNFEIKEDVIFPEADGDEYSNKEYDEQLGEVDEDLTTKNKDMVFVMMLQMMQNPESYIGYRVRMKGMYYALCDEGEDTRHYCIILDAMGCCAQGMEFQWNEGDDSFPEESLEESDPIVIQGVWEAYQRPEDSFTYYRLGDTKMILLEKDERLNRIQPNE